jgi:parallel beta-helix repeat protein
MALLATALIAFFALGAGQAPANHVQCGDTVTQDTTLDSDLIDCPRKGIVIGADNVTLDLSGHTIDGLGFPHAGIGVDVRGHDSVAIENGTIREFGSFGVVFDGVNESRVRRLTISDVDHDAVLLVDSERNVIERNLLLRDGAGITLFDASHNNLITRNSVLDPDVSGIGVRRSHNVSVERNTVFAAADGIDIDGSENLILERNTVEDRATGLFVGAALNASVRKNHVLRGGVGIWIGGTDSSVVEKNLVRGALRWGIAVNPPSGLNLLRHNVAMENGGDGIKVFEPDRDSPGPDTLAHNRADYNDELGINAASDTIDGGGNRAFGNGNPLQCLNVECK